MEAMKSNWELFGVKSLGVGTPSLKTMVDLSLKDSRTLGRP